MRANVLVATVALGLGAAAGSFFVGRAHAQQPMPMPRFQYTCLTKMPERYWSPEMQAKLNEMGAQGWQLEPLRPPGGPDVFCFERRY